MRLTATTATGLPLATMPPRHPRLTMLGRGLGSFHGYHLSASRTRVLPIVATSGEGFVHMRGCGEASSQKKPPSVGCDFGAPSLALVSDEARRMLSIPSWGRCFAVVVGVGDDVGVPLS